MIAAIIALAGKLLGIFFPSKSAEKTARDDGLSAGTAMQKSADQSAVLKDIQDAKQASNSVDSAIAGGVPIDQSDGFRRD